MYSERPWRREFSVEKAKQNFQVGQRLAFISCYADQGAATRVRERVITAANEDEIDLVVDRIYAFRADQTYQPMIEVIEVDPDQEVPYVGFDGLNGLC